MHSSIDGEDDDPATLMYPRLAGILYQLIHNNKAFGEASQRQVNVNIPSLPSALFATHGKRSYVEEPPYLKIHFPLLHFRKESME